MYDFALQFQIAHHEKKPPSNLGNIIVGVAG